MGYIFMIAPIFACTPNTVFPVVKIMSVSDNRIEMASSRKKKSAELVLLSALFLAPAAVIWTHALQDATLFALHPALNALALLMCTPSGLYLILERKTVSDYATRWVSIYYDSPIIILPCYYNWCVIFYVLLMLE